MERSVQRAQVEIHLEGSGLSGRTDGGTSAAERKLIAVVAVSFGLLCVLQAGLNISLRLALFHQTSPKQSALNNDTTILTGVWVDNSNNFCFALNTVETEHEKHLLLQHGWVRFGSSIYYRSTGQKSWQQSRDDCLSRGADLLIVNTKEEQDYFLKLSKHSWIGLSRVGKETWEWVDGTPLRTSYWRRNEPNNHGNNEECVEILSRNEVKNWNDNECQAPEHWICERNVTP